MGHLVVGKVVITPSLFHLDQPTARNKVWSCICSRAWGCGGDCVDSRCHRMGWVGYSSVYDAARPVSTYRLTYDPRCPSRPHGICHEMFPSDVFPAMFPNTKTLAEGVRPKSIDTLAATKCLNQPALIHLPPFTSRFRPLHNEDVYHPS